MQGNLLPLMALAASVICTAAKAQDCNFNAQRTPSGKAQALAQEASKTNPCLTVPGLTAKSLTSVWNVFLTSATTGGKRFETVPPQGTPTGKVLATSQGLAFDMQAVAGEGVLGLQVSAGGATILSVASPTQSLIMLPLQRLKPGASYDWVLGTRKATYRGSFELLDAEEAKGVQAKLAAISKTQMSDQVRMLYTAAVYDDAELYVARDQILAQLRALAAP